MICPRGHAFDAHLGGDCPVCGVPLRYPEPRGKLSVTRKELAAIRQGLKAGAILAHLAVRQWPEAVTAQRQITEAILHADMILARNRWGRKNKSNKLVDTAVGRGKVSASRGSRDRKEPKR